MLFEFRVENHRSIQSEQVFSMQSGSDVRHAAAIYGANASGKSNVLAALAFMKSAVLESHRFWESEGGVPREAFAWGPFRRKPSLYEVTFEQEGVQYRYGFVVNDEKVMEEWLHAWPHGRKQVWFERDGAKFKFGDNLKGENKTVEELTRDNALFMSTAPQFRHRQLSSIYRWFRRIVIAGPDVSRSIYSRTYMRGGYGGRHPLRWISDAFSEQLEIPNIGNTDRQTSANLIRDFLKAADVGIIDVRSRPRSEYAGRQSIRDSIMLLHESKDGGQDAWLSLRQESSGTQKLLEFAWPVFSVLANGGVLVVDELERSLHSLLSAFLVSQFTDSQINKHNAQLIFTTHDTNLLSTQGDVKALMRNDVWLTEKARSGATVICPLSDYKPRKNENLERGYLQGRYGGIPFVGSLMNSLGLEKVD